MLHIFTEHSSCDGDHHLLRKVLYIFSSQCVRVPYMVVSRSHITIYMQVELHHHNLCVTLKHIFQSSFCFAFYVLLRIMVVRAQSFHLGPPLVRNTWRYERYRIISADLNCFTLLLWCEVAAVGIIQVMWVLIKCTDTLAFSLSVWEKIWFN